VFVSVQLFPFDFEEENSQIFHTSVKIKTQYMIKKIAKVNSRGWQEKRIGLVVLYINIRGNLDLAQAIA